MGDSLSRLTDAATLLSDEARVLRLAVEALHEACGRGVAFGLTTRGANAQRRGLCHILVEGRPMELEIPHAVFVRSPAYDVNDVPLAQRNSWIEPFRDGVASLESWRKGSFAPLLGHLDLRHLGRMAVCSGRRQVAVVGVGLRDPDFSDAEREGVVATAEALIVPLRVAALAADAKMDASPLQRMLDESDEAIVALDEAGEILDCSPRAAEAIRRDRSFAPMFVQLVGIMPRKARVVRRDDFVVHISRCELGRVAYLAVVDGEAFVEPPLQLTERQRELIGLLERGHTNAQIASAMAIAPSTVKTMLDRLYEKAGVSGRVELLSLLAKTSAS